MKITNNKVKALEKAVELLVLGLKVASPKLTDKEAKMVIMNAGSYLRLKENCEITKQVLKRRKNEH